VSFSEGVRAALEGWGLADWMVVVLLTLAPILEVRASIPVAMLFYGWSWPSAFVVAFLASLLIIPLAYVALITFERLARHSKRLAAMLDWLWKRTRLKGKKAERLGGAGLFAIVALPLPGAGTWTACITAYVLGLPVRTAAFTIVVGAAVECAILVLVVIFFQGALGFLG
jgi:uncharacterized membrane protein